MRDAARSESDVRKLSRGLIRYVRHGHDLPRSIFDNEGFVLISDLIGTHPIAKLFEGRNVDVDAKFDGVAYADHGKGSGYNHYELIACGQKNTRAAENRQG